MTNFLLRALVPTTMGMLLFGGLVLVDGQALAATSRDLPESLAAVGIAVWGTPSSWGLLAVTHRTPHTWIGPGTSPSAPAFGAEPRDRHSIVPCDVDRDGQDEVLVSVGSLRGKGKAVPELWSLADGVWKDVAASRFPSLQGLRGRGLSCDDIDGDGTPELGMYSFKGPVPDTVLRWSGTTWTDVAPAWNLALSANTHGVRYEDMDGDGDLDGLRLVARRLSLLIQEAGPRFVERPEAVGTLVAGFLPMDADNDGDVDLFLARSLSPKGDDAGADGFRLSLPAGDEDRLSWRIPPDCGRLTVSVAGEMGERPARVRLGRHVGPFIEVDPSLSSSAPTEIESGIEAWIEQENQTLWLRAIGPSEQIKGSVSCAGEQGLALVDAQIEIDRSWKPVPNQLWLNDGSGVFTAFVGAVPDGPERATMGRPTAADVDLDGDLDVLVVTTQAIDSPRNAADYLLLNDGSGRFSLAPDFPADHAPEGGLLSVAADLDGDRYPELLVVNSETPGASPPWIWQNPGGKNRWVEVRVFDRGGRARSLGAMIEVRTSTETQRQRAVPYPDYRANGNTAGVFGIGLAGAALVRVLWPDGAATDWQRVSAGGTKRVVHP